MAIHLKTAEEIGQMRVAGRLAGEVLDFVAPRVKPGVTTGELDRLCHELIVHEQKAIPAPLNYAPPGYKPFPKSICTSVNHQVCHGIPGERVLKGGDILNIDVTVIKDGFHGDSSRMYYVGEPSIQAKRLCETTYECMWLGIREVRPGAYLGDVGAAIQQHAESHGYSVVREFCGHGIGRKFHEEPQVLHYGRSGTGASVVQNLRFFVEFSPDSMAAEFAHDAVAVAFGMLLDRRADVTEISSGAHLPDAEPHALVSGLAQPFCLDRRLADVVHAAGIAVKTVLDHGDVDVQDIASLEHALPWNAVADLVVDRGADRFGKGLVAGRGVIQRGGDCLLLLDDQVMAKTVEFAGRDSGLDVRGDEVKHFPGKLPGHAHARNLLGGLHVYRHASAKKCEG